MRRQPDRALEQADELKGREIDTGGQLLQPQIRVVLCAHALRHAREQK